jgi:DNA-binding NarL/FixJ family response regulator
VKKLRDLRERAASEHVERKYSPPSPAPERLTREQNERIAELYRSGVRPVDIARIVGTTDWTVNHRLNRMGVERRPKGMTQAQRDEAVRAYEDGDSMRQISLRIGFNDKTIKKALIEGGVEIRESPWHRKKRDQK